jgi:hypothetical protein
MERLSRPERNNRCAARHCFDHDQTEGFRPVDRKQQSRSPSKKALLCFVVDFAGQLEVFPWAVVTR